MKKIAGVLILWCLFCGGAFGQAANPQNSFTSSEFIANPSLVLNFNDATTNFMDQVSGLSFSGSGYVSAPTGGVVTPTIANSVKYVSFNQAPLSAGSLVSVSVQYPSNCIPSSGQSLTFVVGSAPSGSSIIINNYFTVSVAATSAVQTFTAPANFAAVTTTSGELLGTWAASGCVPGYINTGGSGGYYSTSAQSSLPSSAQAYSHSTSIQYSLSGSVASAGAITPRQPGFDSTQINNTSAEFAYNAGNAAPNATLGDIEWDVPWTMMLQVDRLNWTRSGTLVLASKGDVGSTSNNYWELYLQMDGLYSQLCFTRNGYGTPPTGGGTGTTTQTFCTNGTTLDAMPNGFNYNIVVEGLGTGAGCNGTTCSDIEMWINGLEAGTTLASQSASTQWFGMATLNASGGTGYANSTAFTSSGGGPNCNVTGTMNSSGGVPLTSNGFSFTADNGCTSAPTITLTAPTGAGVKITVGLGGQLMNSTAYPVMVPGYVSGGSYFGVAGATSTQNPTYVDEFAIFPGNLSFGQISNIFYETKFHQRIANLTTKPVLVLDNDGCGDVGNQFSLQLSIALHQYGAVNLAGVVAEDPSVTCEAMWRQMLDQAGLNDIPLSVPTTFTSENSGTAEPVANITAYNASTPLSNAAWESAVTMYRTIFATYSTRPIDIVSGAGMTAIAEFMESPADSISPLTGLQLMAQNAVNGGAIYAEGGGCAAASPPATAPCTGGIGGNLADDYPSAQYVLTHNGALPIYWIGGTPQSAGPGILSTRTSKDPMFLLTTTAGTDVRQCYDCLAVEAAVSSYFYGGVQIGYSGGTGYANSTPFTLSGGGPNCQGSGFMTASGGVPNGIEFSWGASAAGSSSGLGQGCTSAPTVNLAGATGTGVTLTAYPTLVCGTDMVSETGSTWGDSFTSATCSNQYVSPATAYANQTPVSGAPMEWFINSLVDPPPNGQTRVY